MALQMLDLQCKALRISQVVGIHPRDKLSARCAKPAVERASHPAIGLGDDADPRIALRILRKNGRRIIRRSVVDAKKLKIAKALGEDAVDGGAQVSLRVV